MGREGKTEDYKQSTCIGENFRVWPIRSRHLLKLQVVKAAYTQKEQRERTVRQRGLLSVDGFAIKRATVNQQFVHFALGVIHHKGMCVNTWRTLILEWNVLVTFRSAVADRL